MSRDPADNASLISEHFDDLALKHCRKYVPPATGRCLHCADPVAPTLKFCDADCRDDWERFNRQ